MIAARACAMRLLAVVMVLAVFSISSVSAVNCDRTTCRSGPVFLYFEHDNCTGDSYYYSWDANFDVCESGSGYSNIRRIHDSYVEDVRYRGVQDCGGGRDDAIISRGTRYYFGVCSPNSMLRKTSGASYYNAYILLANVNDTFTSPQPFALDNTLPEASRGSQSCTSPEDCQAKGKIYYQYFTNDTCSETVEYEAYTGMVPYTCHRDTNTYVMVGCQGPHTYTMDYFIDSACTIPRYSYIYGDKCGLDDGSTSTTHCTAVRPIVPASSASTFQPMAIVYGAAILLAIFF